MPVIRKSKNNKYWQGYREKRTLLHCWWECKLVQPLWRIVWRFLTKNNKQLPYDPAIPPGHISGSYCLLLTMPFSCQQLYGTKVPVCITGGQHNRPEFSKETSLASLTSPWIIHFPTASVTYLQSISSVEFSSVAQSRLTLCDPVDCSPPGSSIHWILQARVLEWVAISFSRGSSQPRDQTQVSCIAGKFFTA